MQPGVLSVVPPDSIPSMAQVFSRSTVEARGTKGSFHILLEDGQTIPVQNMDQSNIGEISLKTVKSIHFTEAGFQESVVMFGNSESKILCTNVSAGV